MKAYVIYNRSTPAERLSEDWAKRLKDAEVDTELLDADSARGIQFVEDYDVLGRPAIALVRNDGSPVQIWQGEDGLPAVADISYLAHQ